MALILQPPFGVPVFRPDGTMDLQWQAYFDSLSRGIPTNFAPIDAQYLVATSDPALTGERNLGALSTGYLKVTVGAGIATPSTVTAIPATDLSGTIPDARFPATLPAVSGVNLTALNASALGSGTVPDARFPATLPVASGVNLTALNASAMASGTVAQARKWAEATTTLTGTQNDVNFSSGDSLRCNNGGGALTLTGLLAGVAGQVLRLWAIAANTVTLNHQDAGSAAANRLITATGAAVVLTASVGYAELQYDGTTARWRVAQVT